MKFLYILFLFLAYFGLTFSDYFITSISPSLNQSYFVIPLVVFSLFFINKKFSFFFKLISLYISIGILFFILYGLSNLALLSNLIGTVFVSFAFYNFRFRFYFEKYAFNLFILFSLYFCLLFYLGFWETSITGRSTVIKHNENFLSQILNIGLSFSILKYFYNNKIKARYYLYSAFFHVLPILATVSRTGITLMLLSFVFLIWVKFDKKIRLTIVISSTLIMLISGTFVFQYLNKSEFFKMYIERTSQAKDDERGELWKISYNLALDNILTGTGFDQFYDYRWRKSVGLVTESYDNQSNLIKSEIVSVHNSFIDLVLIGGIWLLLVFVFIIYYPVINAIKFLTTHELKIIGGFILVLVLNVIFYSFTGQAATQKITWFLIGVCYFEIDKKIKRIG